MTPMKLKVCGRFEVPDFAGQGYTHMISIGDSNDYFDGLRLPDIAGDDYLVLKFTDTTDPDHPDAPSVEGLAVLRTWLAQRTGVEGLLVHCAGGISRSPAVALLALAHFFPEDDPFEQMRHVARSAECSYVWPNQRLIEIGDGLLDRNGRIVQGVLDWKEERRNQDPVEFL